MDQLKKLPPMTDYFRIEFSRGELVKLKMDLNAKEYGYLDRCRGRAHAGGIDIYEAHGEPLPGGVFITVGWSKIKQAWRKAEDA